MNALLYNFLWVGKSDKIRRSGVCQAYEAGGLKMVDINPFCLRRRSVVSVFCTMIENLLKFYKQCVHWFKMLNNEVVSLQIWSCKELKKKKSIWVDVFIHYQKKKKSGKYTPVTFDDFVSECLHYSVNIRRGKGVVRIGNWIDCGIISLGQFLWSALISFLQWI